MEQNVCEQLWRVWVDTQNRIVSFHEMDGCQMMEFRDRETFFRYVNGFVGKSYRYQ